MKPSPKNDQSGNEGEGNRTADRHYREGVQEHVKSGASEAAAKEAEKALEGDEGAELRQAEEEGKSRGKSV
jgi:hypothetical protein